MAIFPLEMVSCFDIGEVPRSPGKWNWNWLYFLPFIFTFEQGVMKTINSTHQAYFDLVSTIEENVKFGCKV